MSVPGECESESELYPVGPALGWRNRRISARRTGWPDGAVQACEQIDADHEGWNVWWGTGRVDEPDRPGFYANRENRTWGEPSAYGATPEELVKAMTSWPYQDVREHGPMQLLPVTRRDA